MNPEYLEALWSVFLTCACFMAAASDMLTPDTKQGAADGVDNAVAIYDELVGANPDQPQWHALRGMTLLSIKDYQRALVDIDALIRLEPDVASYHLLRGLACSQSNRLDEAIAACSDAIRLAPHDSNAYLLRAVCWAQKHDYKKAIADLDEVILQNPDEASHLVTRGQLFLANGQFERARADARKAIRSSSSQKLGLMLHTNLSIHCNDIESALLDCERILQLDPRNADILRGRVWIYQSQQEYGLALAETLELLETDCRQIQIDSIEDFARRSMSQADLTLKSHDIASANPQQLVTAHLARGRALMTLDLPDPIADFDAAIQMDPERTQAYMIRGQAWMNRGEPRRAIEDFNTVLRQSPDDARAWAGRGMAYAASLDWRQACDDFSEALSLAPDLQRIKVRRGIAWQALKEWQHAIDDFKDVAKEPAFYVRDMARLDEVKKPAPAAEVKEKPKQTESTWNPFSDPTTKPMTGQSNNSGTATLWAELAKLSKDGTTNNQNNAANASQAVSLNYPVKFDPLYIDAFLRLGECYEARNQWDKALETYNKLVQLAPEESRAYRRLACALGTCPDDRVRSTEQAVGYAWKAIERQHAGDEVDNLTVLAAVYSELGDFDRAIEFQQQARSITATSSEKDFQQRQETLVSLDFQRSLNDVDQASLVGQRRTIKTAIKECQQSNWTCIAAIERLADAYANAGELEAAQHCQMSAQLLKTEDKDKPLVDRLSRYRTGITYREQDILR